MMKNILIAFLFVVPLSANAGWVNFSEDDVFTGGKKSMLSGGESQNAGLVFDCTADSLALSYIEKTKENEIAKIPMTMLIKVDAGDVKKLDSVLERRNNDYLGIVNTDKVELISILKEIKVAKSKVLVGITTQGSDQRHSFTVGVRGSTQAVNEFAKACGINL